MSCVYVVGMYKVILDTNVWDKLSIDVTTRETLAKAIRKQLIEVIIPDTLARELNESPFQGVPNFFPVRLTADGMTILGHSRLGYSRLSDGKIYKQHLGNSNSIKDAIIAETADTNCDIFVSEDKRCIKRLKKISKECQCMAYDNFKEWLRSVVTAC